MRKKKSVLLTFDYELFLGQSGTPEVSLFEPTSRLISIFKTYNIKAIFFIDILYYYRMLEEETEKDNCRKFVNQLQELIINGHDVELHLHPHWLDAKYKDGVWDLSDLSKYKLDSLSVEQVGMLFDIGIKLLTEICLPVKSNYTVKAFRAGGLCVLPFDKLLPSFIKHNLKIDSSIAPRYLSLSETHDFDYTAIHFYNPYKFNKTPVKKDDAGSIIEIPVHWFWANLIDKLEMKFKKSTVIYKIAGDGKGVSGAHKQRSAVERFLLKFNKSVFFFSFDHSEIPYRLFLRKLKNNRSESLTIMTHPKIMSEKSFLELDLFLKEDCFKIVSLSDYE